ncbi:MAG: MBOAT family protein, partial [Clostridia bacterium]|nr:MBOAT family protein [Clostridia bacterium]
ASLNFLLWGLFFFLLLAGERFVWGGLLAHSPRLLQHGYLLFCVLMGWLLFAFDGSEASLTATDGIEFFNSLFAVGKIGINNGNIWYEVERNISIVLIMIIGSTPIMKKLFRLIQYKKPSLYFWISFCLCLFGIVISVAFLTVESYNPFLYFRF